MSDSHSCASRFPLCVTNGNRINTVHCSPTGPFCVEMGIVYTHSYSCVMHAHLNLKLHMPFCELLLVTTKATLAQGLPNTCFDESYAIFTCITQFMTVKQ